MRSKAASLKVLRVTSSSKSSGMSEQRNEPPISRFREPKSKSASLMGEDWKMSTNLSDLGELEALVSTGERLASSLRVCGRCSGPAF